MTTEIVWVFVIVWLPILALTTWLHFTGIAVMATKNLSVQTSVDLRETQKEISKWLSEIEERLDALDNCLDSGEFTREDLLQAAQDICTKPRNAHTPQMKRSGRVEYNHQVEGTE